MIFNMSGGGGAALNFKVMGGTAEPSNPAENTIWIDTDAKITGWLFSSHQPENPAEGMVWIATGSASNAEFNALKKNSIQVYPLSAKQYIGGAWVDLDAYLYNGAEWVQFSTERLFLYNKGDKCEAITGGWGTAGYSHYSYSLSGPAFNSASVRIASNGGTNAGAMGTQNKIDLTGINAIKFNYTAVDGYAYVYVSSSKDSPDRNCVAESSANWQGEYTLNVSHVNGSYYIFIIVFGSTQKPSNYAVLDRIEMFR